MIIPWKNYIASDCYMRSYKGMLETKDHFLVSINKEEKVFENRSEAEIWANIVGYEIDVNKVIALNGTTIYKLKKL